jgi:quinol monooxygenase YgiN
VIHVIATVTLRTGRRDHFLAAFNDVAAKVRCEAGCVEYFASVDVASGLPRQGDCRADVVTVLEKWIDLAALEAHSKASHMQEFRERCKYLIISSELQVLRGIEPR